MASFPSVGARVRVSHRKPCFFKVFLPSLSSQHLRIPPKFRKHINGEKSPKTVSLTAPNGSTWNVDLVRNSEGLFFEGGWKEFASDHSLVSGDFLVFRYEGDSLFSVLIFDNTACEKDEALSAKPCRDKSEGAKSTPERRKKGVDDCIVLEGSSKKRGSDDCVVLEGSSKKRGSDDCVVLEGSSKKRRKRVTDDCVVLEGSRKMKHCPLVKVKDEELKSSSRRSSAAPKPGKVAKASPGSRTLKSRSSSDKPKKLGETIAKASPSSRTLNLPSSSAKSKEFGKASASTHPSKTSAKHPPLQKSSQMVRQGEVVVKKQRYGALISQRRQIKKQELEKALEMAKSFTSENPFFMVEMQESHVYYGFFMNFPKKAVMEHFNDQSRHLTLWDPNGRDWKVHYISYGWRGGLSGGWGKFSVANNLEKGDICIFEFIKEDDLRVHIFRVVEELTPLIRYSKEISLQISKRC